jgi:iron complex outermembrane receptor protein
MSAPSSRAAAATCRASSPAASAAVSTGTTGSIDASFLVLAVSSQDHVGVADLATDGYTSVDAQVRWKPFKAKPGIALTLVGHNLADETIRNATALNKDSVLMPGRDVRLVLSAKF